MSGDFFIKRPKFAFVISIVMSLTGLVCMLRLPIAEYPEIAPPTVRVTAMYPGATSSVIADTVATVIEEQVNGIEDLLYFKSECDNNGNYTLTLTFRSGINDDIATVNVQNAVERAKASLPDTVVAMGVVTQKQSTDIVGVYSFLADESKMSILDLSNYVRMNVKTAFSRLEGMGFVEILGERTYSMRIWLDPLKMSALGILPEQVMGKLQSQNHAFSAGSLGGEKASPYLQMKVEARGRLKTPEEFAEIVIRTGSDGGQVLLGDIARISIGAEMYTSDGTFAGEINERKNQASVAIALYRQAGANAVKLIKDGNKLLKELEKRFPDGMTAFLMYDPTDYILENVKEISLTLILTILLVVVITWLFLQNWRAAMVPALAIPVSLLGTFFVMTLLDYSINVLTLFGLILVIGSLVDNAIVVVENTMRIMDEERLSPAEATAKSMGQITSPVIAATLVAVAVYAPIGFYGGIVGTIYKQFAVTMCVALLLSTVNALTLSPALCALLLKPSQPGKRPFFLYRWLDAGLNCTRNGYMWFARLMVRRGIITMAIVAAVLAANFQILKGLHGGFLPDEDKGSFLCEMELPPGASLARTNTALAEFTEKAVNLPGVKNVVTCGGFSLMSGAAENLGFMIIQLDRWEKRTAKDMSIMAMRDKLRAIGETIPEGIVRVFCPPAVMGLGVTGGVTFALRTTGDYTPMQFEQQMGRMLAALNDKGRMPNVMYAYSGFNTKTPHYYLDIDRRKAEALGVPFDRINMALATNLASMYVNDFNISGFSFKVKLQMDNAERDAKDKLEQLMVANDHGEMVPLSAFTDVKTMRGPRKIERFNQNMASVITAIPVPGASTASIMADIEEFVANEFGKDYDISWTDMSYQEHNNQGQIALLLAMAFLFAYLFLVAQYESWTIPLPVMLSVAFATLGGLAALKYTGMLLDIYAQLGVIMLIGLCSKSTVLMVEFSMQERTAGRSIEEAAVNGVRYRFRAVLMTAWSFIIGVLPLLFASGAGAEARRVIGTTTFWGMLFATVVGVAFVPPMYALAQRLRERIKSSASVESQGKGFISTGGMNTEAGSKRT